MKNKRVLWLLDILVVYYEKSWIKTRWVFLYNKPFFHVRGEVL